ncbi:MAG: class I SAM-dependent methyltransferase, partial [bacterium]|nr:class I SAM-dependent methyltransferase [bacterium]
MIKKLNKLDARIINWNCSDLIERNCPVCNGRGTPAYIRPDDLTVKHCKDCDIWFVSPAPSPGQLDDFYSQYDQKHRVGAKLSTIRQPEFRHGKLSPLNRAVFDEITSLTELQGQKCLDVGYGRGHFLTAFRGQGAEVYGVDPDLEAFEYARDVLKIPGAKQGTIFDLE